MKCVYSLLCPIAHSKVEQYSDQVHGCAEVRFAIAAAQAVDSNNFVRFFKLVRYTCIYTAQYT